MKHLLALAIGLVSSHAQPGFAQSAIPIENVAINPNSASVCILSLRLEQLSWTLNPLEHIKDRANATVIDLPVVPDFCRQLRPGQVLSSQFRWGSYLLRGGTGEMVVTVERISYSAPGSLR
jgi:hypothetical protein